jgi:membrane-bound lytic murein transglycosylase A
MRFVILVPKILDPAARGRKMPLPDARPSTKIAKLFPQVDPLKAQKNGTKPADTSAAPSAKDTVKTAEPAKNPAAAAVQPTTAVAQASTVVPLPEARPNIARAREVRRHRHYRYHRGR